MRIVSRKGIFITGTDTGVGKTVVAAAFVSVFRKAGLNAVPMKPIQTGCVRRGDQWAAPDLEFVARAAGLAVTPEDVNLMAPYRFGDACSPHLAAERAGATIALARVDECFRLLEDRCDMVVVEGAGGVLAPVAGDQTMLDLMARLSLRVVLVSRPGLGTINHTLLSLREMARAGLQVLGVVINAAGPAEWSYVEEDNCRTIERLGQVSVLGRMPFLPGIGDGAFSPDGFHGRVARCLPAAGELIRLISN